MKNQPASKQGEGMEPASIPPPENIPLIAMLQKGILVAMAGMFFAAMVFSIVPGAASLVALASIANAFLLSILAFLLRMPVPLLYFAFGFIPPLGLLAVFFVNARATSILKQSGLRVGLLGVSLKDIIALQKR